MLCRTLLLPLKSLSLIPDSYPCIISRLTQCVQIASYHQPLVDTFTYPCFPTFLIVKRVKSQSAPIHTWLTNTIQSCSAVQYFYPKQPIIYLQNIPNTHKKQLSATLHASAHKIPLFQRILKSSNPAFSKCPLVEILHSLCISIWFLIWIYLLPSNLQFSVMSSSHYPAVETISEYISAPKYPAHNFRSM